MNNAHFEITIHNLCMNFKPRVLSKLCTWDTLHLRIDIMFRSFMLWRRTSYIKEMLISSFFPWFVVLASFTVRVIVYGITYTSGIVYVIILKNFQTGKAETSWTSSIITTVMFATGKTFRRHKTHWYYKF